MGCSYPPETFENEIRILEEKKKKLIDQENEINEDISFIFYQTLEKIITLNPFFNLTLSQFQETLDSIINAPPEENDINNYTNKILDYVTTKFFKNEKTFVITFYKKVVDFCLKNYNFGINEEGNNNLIILIIKFIYIFFSDNRAGKKELFRQNIFEILKFKNDNKNEVGYKYNREKLYNIIINLVQIHIFFFQNLLLYFALGEIFTNNDGDYEEIINNDSSFNKINSFIVSNLEKINESISFEFLKFLFISQISNKIKSILEEDNDEDLIVFDANQIHLLIDSIYEIININNFITFLFFRENNYF